MLLLDTHVLLWMVLDDPRLSRRGRSEIEKADRLVYSIASFWEIAIKLSLPKYRRDLPLPTAWHQELLGELREIGSVRLEIQPEHCRRLQDLPRYHRDPFDRMLIAQAQTENLSILSADKRFKQYGVKVVW